MSLGHAAVFRYTIGVQVLGFEIFGFGQLTSSIRGLSKVEHIDAKLLHLTRVFVNFVHNCRMEIDCDEGMDMSSVQGQDLEFADAIDTRVSGLVRAGSLQEDNHRLKVSSSQCGQFVKSNGF